jgi:hypothetical protein
MKAARFDAFEPAEKLLKIEYVQDNNIINHIGCSQGLCPIN